MATLLNVGDKIGKTTWEVKKVAQAIVKRYRQGRKVRVKTTFYFIENPSGQQRVLNWKKTKVSEAEMYCPTFGHSWKYKKWNQITII